MPCHPEVVDPAAGHLPGGNPPRTVPPAAQEGRPVEVIPILFPPHPAPLTLVNGGAAPANYAGQVMVYKDRADAARLLADALSPWRGKNPLTSFPRSTTAKSSPCSAPQVHGRESVSAVAPKEESDAISVPPR